MARKRRVVFLWGEGLIPKCTLLDFFVMAILSGVFFFLKKTNITVYVSYYFSDINVTVLIYLPFL